MNLENITAILDAVTKLITLGGDMTVIGLKAYRALKSESGMTDEQLLAATKAENEANHARLLEIIGEDNG